MEGVARSSGTRTCSVPTTKGKVGKFEVSVLTATKQTTPNGTTRLSSVSQTSLVSLTIGCKDFQFPKVSWFLRCPLGVPVMAYGQQSCPPGYAAEERHNLTMKPLKKSCGCLGGGAGKCGCLLLSSQSSAKSVHKLYAHQTRCCLLVPSCSAGPTSLSISLPINVRLQGPQRKIPRGLKTSTFPFAPCIFSLPGRWTY